MSVLFKRFVEPGRLVYINYGPDEGKMATVVDICTLSRVVIDGPTTGVKRQLIPVRRLTLTDQVTPNVFRGAREKTLKKALTEDGTFSKWGDTTWAKKMAAKKARANLSDFDRFKLMLARKKRSGQIKAEVKKVMGKGALADAIAGQAELKKSVVAKMLGSLASIAAKEVKSNGKFVLPGLVMVKTRLKPARKAGKRIAFGKEVHVKAAPAKTAMRNIVTKSHRSSVIIGHRPLCKHTFQPQCL